MSEAAASETPGSESDPASETGPAGRRPRGVIVAVVGLVVLIGIVVSAVFVSRGGTSADERYLAALDEAGLNDWATDRAAVNAGYTVCEQLDGGGPPRGSARDALAVEHLCPDYVEWFRVLETADVVGTFTVVSSGDFTGSIGSTCRPDGGYGDINSSTQVIVRNPAGTELVRTSLGQGEIERRGRCTFTFEVELTEGETSYIVEVGRRGEIGYTWDEVSRPGAVALVLGD